MDTTNKKMLYTFNESNLLYLNSQFNFMKKFTTELVLNQSVKSVQEFQLNGEYEVTDKKRVMYKEQ